MQAIMHIQTLVEKVTVRQGVKLHANVCVLETKKDEVIGNRRHKHLILTKVKANGQNVAKFQEDPWAPVGSAIWMESLGGNKSLGVVLESLKACPTSTLLSAHI